MDDDLDSMPTMKQGARMERAPEDEHSLDSMPTMKPGGASPAQGGEAEEAERKAREEAECIERGDGRFAGDTRKVEIAPGVEMAFVWVAPGSFSMGSDDAARPVHPVTLTKGYWLGKYEVTQAEWRSVMGENPSWFKGDSLPVEYVSWDDCQEFARKVNAHLAGLGEKMRVRLPAEAEWEFASRGGTKGKGYKYSGSDDIGKVAWYGGNSGGKTHEVGMKAANELGIHDMSGNVCEWCADWYGGYASGAVADPRGPRSGDYRVIRGGRWSNGARSCRSANRHGSYPGNRCIDLGVRLAASEAPTLRVTAVLDGGEVPHAKLEIGGKEYELPATVTLDEGEDCYGSVTLEQDGKRYAGALSVPKADWKGERRIEVALKETKGEGSYAGEEREVEIADGVKMVFVWVAPGSFRMGSDAYPSEKPHQVTLTKGYWIGKYEVTQAEWRSVMGENPSRFNGGRLPVECVSWDDCQEFARKVNAHLAGLGEKLRVRLPTEAEWEFASRGGTKSKWYKYSGSDDIGAVAWYKDKSGGETHDVGTKSGNELGIHDMSGNVWEWCADWKVGYASGAVADPRGPASGYDRVYRGGSWVNGAWSCRSANRHGSYPGNRCIDLGVRLAASAGQ